MTYVLCMRLHCISIWNLAKSYDFFLLRFGAKWYILEYKTVNWKAWRVNNCTLCKVCVTGNSSKDAHVLTRRDCPKYILHVYIYIFPCNYQSLEYVTNYFSLQWNALILQLVWKLEREFYIISGQSLLVYLNTEIFLMNCVSILVVTK